MGIKVSQVGREEREGNYRHWMRSGVQDRQRDGGVEMQWRTVYSKLIDEISTK